MTSIEHALRAFAASDGRPRPAASAAEVRGASYRFTVLTSRLIRMEWSAKGEFVDAPTAVVTQRNFGNTKFEVRRDGDSLHLRTGHLELHYDGREFSPSGLSVDLFGAPDIHYSTWRFGDDLSQLSQWRGNLGGTARTLDNVDGTCPLEPGLLSTFGFATLDDSASVLLTEDGWVGERPEDGQDLYLFAHGLDYQGALDDFFKLTDRPALVPRHVLGNWWSRYWRYDQEGLLELLDGFSADRIPFSVAVIDMDWHIVDVDPELGTGWTGYSWNRELFPDPPALLSELHDRGLAVTLNVHPADGVRRHEDAYEAMADAMGIDAATGVAIPFDIASRRFVEAYLSQLHHPLEAEGVDFWWLDWQSGGTSRVRGLDPLWMLNHVHFKDSARDGRRPLTFSRYSGPGSHRYPIGFSGDTVATWESLDFQPYFTSTAANIGYFWWSHDIGGHMHGVSDPELTARWMQLGALSPVNRLHSSSSPFASKEPRLLGAEASEVAARFLRLRHVLVPYLYTAAWAAHAQGRALARPLYHDHPKPAGAYDHPNTYFLGPDLLVAPITTPRDLESRLAAVTAWLPEGRWVDVFTGYVYEGARTVTFYRSLCDYPVLARAGAVIPLQADALAPVGANPEHLVLRVFEGDATSVLIEDDGSAEPEPWRTRIRVERLPQPGASIDLRVTIGTEGHSHPRVLQTLSVDLAGIVGVEGVFLEVDGEERLITVETPDDDAGELLGTALRLRTESIDLHESIVLHVRGVRRASIDVPAVAFELLRRARIEYTLKDRAYAACQRLTGMALASELAGIGLPQSLIGALVEVLACAEVERTAGCPMS